MAENWRPLCDAERIKQIWTLFKESPGILRSLLCGGTDMNSVSLKSRLRNLAIKEKKPYDYIQMHYMIERLLQRFSVWGKPPEVPTSRKR